MMQTLFLSLLMAITPVEQADADVAVLVLCVDIAETDKPVLPSDHHNGQFQSAPTLIESSEGIAAIEALAREQLSVNIELRKEIERLNQELLNHTLKSVPDPGDEPRAAQGVNAHIPKLIIEDENAPQDAPPLVAGDVIDEVTVFTGEDAYGDGWCRNCQPYLNMLEATRNGDKSLKITKSKAVAPPTGRGNDSYPAVRFKKNGEWVYPSDGNKNYILPNSYQELKRFFNADPKPEKSYNAMGFGGSLKAKPMIKAMLAGFKSNIGYNNRAEGEWGRTGIDSFNLLRIQDELNAEAVLGRSGSFRLRAKNPATLVNIKEIGFTYFVSGKDMSFDFDKFTVAGLAGQLNFNDTNAVSAGPSQFIDPMTIWTVISIVRTVWAIMHPQMDIRMGNSIMASAVLTDNNGVDQLDIEFSKWPEVRIVILFEFLLGVKHVTITEDKIHVDFSGSNWIKSRDFRVTESCRSSYPLAC